MSSYVLNDLRNFNKIFKKDVNYDNVKSHNKKQLHCLSFPLSKRYIFEPQPLALPLSSKPFKVLMEITLKGKDACERRIKHNENITDLKVTSYGFPQGFILKLFFFYSFESDLKNYSNTIDFVIIPNDARIS